MSDSISIPACLVFSSFPCLFSLHLTIKSEKNRSKPLSLSYRQHARPACRASPPPENRKKKTKKKNKKKNRVVQLPCISFTLPHKVLRCLPRSHLVQPARIRDFPIAWQGPNLLVSQGRVTDFWTQGPRPFIALRVDFAGVAGRRYEAFVVGPQTDKSATCPWTAMSVFAVCTAKEDEES